MASAPRLAQVSLIFWGTSASLWILDVNFLEVSSWLSIPVTLGALLSTLLSLAAVYKKSSPPLLLPVLIVAVIFGFAGLGHEVGKGYYTDEGHYLHHAREVNAGKPFTRSFVYPHLLYYLDGFALWLADLFERPVDHLSRAVYGVEEAAAVDWWVLRLVCAGLGSLTVVPVFLIAWQIAGKRKDGLLAAGIASGLLIFSVHYQEGFQVNICDVPSAFFATLCLMFVARLTEEEKSRDYLWTGVAAGLAAATKYPAGVVAIAIVAVWLFHRLRSKDWSWGLLGAGLSSLGVFLLLHPSLFVHPDAVFGRRGIFFGLRQYGKGGWVGVMPESNTVYYLERLLENFGALAVLLAAAGFWGLERGVRRRLLWLSPFPLVFLVLLASMNMVVLRNLFPVIPILAVFLGVCASGLRQLAAARSPGHGRLAAVALVTLTLALPASAAARQTWTLLRPSTRDLMAAWIRENVPRGSGILKEAYTPDFYPREFRTVHRRFAFRIPEERLEDPRFEFVLLAGSAYWRWFRPENEDGHQAAWYRRIFETRELVHEVASGPWRRGPELRLYRLRPEADSLSRDSL